MTTTLEKSMKELAELPEDQQAVIVERLRHMISRAKIDARLADAEECGGETLADQFFAELKVTYGN